ncbi:DUF58 domain-containing protein [Haloferula sargassicola]|uniref:DUF58 domain-containing protein n=1 Tax=Haloferula sargassicola TaxID=490096 RepID=A0ABP9USZ5_9BACT
MTRGRIGTRGHWVAGTSAALAVAGLLRVDGALLAVSAAGLLLLGVAWVLGRANVSQLAARLEGPRAVVAESPARARLTLSNRRRWLDGFRLGISISGPGRMALEMAVPWVPAGSQAGGGLAFQAPDRGLAEALSVEARSDFPWGLFEFRSEWRLEQEMIVLPRPIRPPARAWGWERGGETPARSWLEEPGDRRGLRGYMAGDRVKTIRWPASVRSAARGGGLMVAEPDPPGGRDEEVWLVFHSCGDGGLIRPARFERAVSLLWGETERLVGMGRTVVWLADFLEWVPQRMARRSDLAEAGEILARARRASGTQKHEVLGRLAETRGPIRVFSDQAAAHWQAWLSDPESAVDVVRFEKGGLR